VFRQNGLGFANRPSSRKDHDVEELSSHNRLPGDSAPSETDFGEGIAKNPPEDYSGSGAALDRSESEKRTDAIRGLGQAGDVLLDAVFEPCERTLVALTPEPLHFGFREILITIPDLDRSVDEINPFR